MRKRSTITPPRNAAWLLELLADSLRLTGHECVLLALACAIALPVYLETQMLHSSQAAFAAQHMQNTPAMQTQPHTDWSFYMTVTTSSTIYNLGCNQGKFDGGLGIDSMVVLDFGGQQYNSGGTQFFDGTNITNTEVVGLAENFILGYVQCLTDSNSVLTLGLGVNNDNFVSNLNGQLWGQNINAVQSWISRHNYAGHAFADGADDIEAWDPNDSWAAPTISWVQGYDSTANEPYLDYGTADDCPVTPSNNAYCLGSCPHGYPCNHSWNQYDFWYDSYGNGHSFATPEIYGADYWYGNDMAMEWTMLSLYGYDYQTGAITFEGPWDDHDIEPGKYTSAQAWMYLWDDLNTLGYPGIKQDMPYSLEIHNET